MKGKKARSALIGAASAVVLALAGCGSQLSEAELQAGAFGTALATPGTVAGADGTIAGGIDPATGGGVGGGVGADGGTGTGGAGAGGAGGTGSTGGGAGSSGGTSTTGGGGSGSGTGGGSGAVAANNDPIVIGQIGEFSGIAGAAQSPAQTGLQAWAKYVNARGGVSGHPVKLISLDNGGDSAKAKSMAQQLVEQEGAVAIVGAFVALSFPGLVAYTQPHGIPVIGGDLSDAGWHQNSYVFPQGTTQSSLNLGFAQTAARAGKKKLAFFYCIELPACSSSYAALKNGGAKKQGVDLVYGAQVSVGTLNFQSQCSSAKKAGANAVYIIGDAGMTSRMLRDCRQVGLDALYLAPGIATSNSQQSDPNADGLVGLAYDFPYMDSSSAAAREFQSAMSTYARGADLNGSSAQAWVAGQLFAEAVAKIPAGEKVTSKNLVQAMYKVSGTTVGGLAPKLVYRPGKPAPSIDCYYTVRIRNGRWVSDGLRAKCV